MSIKNTENRWPNIDLFSGGYFLTIEIAKHFIYTEM